MSETKSNMPLLFKKLNNLSLEHTKFFKFSDTKKCPSFDVEEWKKIELDWIEGDLLPNDERDE